MEDILPDTDNIDIEGQTSNSVSHIPEGQGNSGTEEQIAHFISEEQTSQWSNEFKTTFERHEVREVGNDVLVRKLRACFRVPLEQYTPILWQIGLHNRDVLHPSESEDLKIAIAAASELGPWEEFCASVVDDPVGVLRAYGLDHSEPKFSMRQMQCLLTLDALTIFLVFAKKAYTDDIFDERPQIGARLTALLKPRLEYLRLYDDLFLFENQIPIALLRKVISTCYEKLIGPNSTLMDHQKMLDDILKYSVCRMCRFIFALTKEQGAKIREAYLPGELEKCPHIVACVYRVLCGPNLKRRSGYTITIQSATALKKAGIQIKGIGGRLDEVGFRERCLYLPIVKLGDQTESFFRNLAMYERVADYTSRKCAFGEYLRLMTSLIKEVGDVKHLIDCGVIENELFTDNNAFQMWNNLQSDLYMADFSKEYEDMVSKINKQCKSSLNVMRTEFYQLFCSRPWYALGVFTGTIVTVGTFLVAYTSVIGSHRMQPHYPP
ncbi:unnamed protein product [Sphagnum balticum]